MPLTLHDVIRHLKYDEDSADLDDLQSLLDVAEQAVRDHVLTKFDAENKAQQRAILLLCGYYDKYRNSEAEMPNNGSFLPQPVLALLNPYYKPLAF
ncbi:head-tail connector protein [Acinetobacter baumannii]|nr:head-tail connector protein [Acinetobacter baumannii]